jgi:TolB-like protein
MRPESREVANGSDDAHTPAEPDAAARGLAFPAFASALKDALRDYHRPDLLARNPLLRQGFCKRDGEGGAAALQALLAETARTLFDNPRDEKKRRVIELTYFEPASKQEAVADRLSLPFGTYRRHLTAARDRLTQWLWDRAAGKSVDAAPSPVGEAIEPHRLSLVVLPFLNIGGGAAHDHFVRGITETLTTDLSRRSCAFIVSRTAAFADRQHPVDVREVGRALGVLYVLEGSVQTSDQRLRINAQLIEARTGIHVWAERFDKPHADLLDVQDEITVRIGRCALIALVAFEARRVADKPLDQRDATDHALCGWAIWNHRLSRQAARDAAACFEAALTLDSDNAGALIGLASCLMWEVNMYGSDDRAGQIRAAEVAVTRALDLRPNDAEAHVTHATVLFAMRMPERALRTLELAVRLDGHNAGAHAYIGLIKFFLGRAEETRGHVATAMRLSPRDPLLFHWLFFIGVADLYLGRRVRALENLRKSVAINPNWALSQFILAGGLALAGLLAEAAEVCAVARHLGPNFTIAKFRGEVVSDSAIYLAQRETMYEGLRLAGVPEG